ncbi:hypothetical protein JMM63_03735 [Rhodovulum sulfidophilum]|nr:hypothetical protein [Rhodovulum sulfidophilum]
MNQIGSGAAAAHATADLAFQPVMFRYVECRYVLAVGRHRSRDSLRRPERRFLHSPEGRLLAATPFGLAVFIHGWEGDVDK